MVSIVVPVYNVEECLESTLCSIQEQSVANFEAVLIDDGSTDSSGEICDTWAKVDERFIAVHKENGGLSSARNVGIDSARGEYIFFVDGDDRLVPKALEALLDALRQTSSDVAIGSLERLRAGTTSYKNDKRGRVEPMTAGECLERLLFCNGVSMSACGKLYRSKAWQSQRFPEGSYYEDMATIPMAIASCERICVVESALYGYVTRVGSITGTGVLSEKKYKDAQIELEKLERFIADSGVVSPDAMGFFMTFTWLRLLRYLPKGDSFLDAGERRLLERRVQSEAAKWRGERKTSCPNRARLALFSLSPSLYELAFRLYDLCQDFGHKS